MNIRQQFRFLLLLLVVLIFANLWIFRGWYDAQELKEEKLVGSAIIKNETESAPIVPFPKAKESKTETSDPSSSVRPESTAPTARGKAHKTRIVGLKNISSDDLLKKGFRSLEESIPQNDEARRVVHRLILDEVHKNSVVILYSENLRFQSQQTMPSKHLLSHTYFTYQQFANGLPVEHAGARGIAKNLPSGPTITYLDYGLAEIPERAIRLQVSEAQALQTAKHTVAVRAAEPLVIYKKELLYRAIQGEWQPVYDFEFEGQGLAVSVQVETGEVFTENRTHAAKNIKGQVGGRGVQFDPVKGVNTLLALPYLTVKGNTGAIAESNVKGAYKITVNADTKLTAMLAGRYAKVNSLSGSNLSLSANVGSALAVNLSFNTGASSAGTAQVNGYYHTNVVREYLRLNGINHEKLDRQVPVYVNSTEGTCNAYYQSGAIRFFRESTDCVNTAFDTVVYHEYGHLTDDAFGGITSGGLSEGWGDVLAILITAQPVIGEGFFKKAGTEIRNAVNTYVYKATDECAMCPPHKVGQALSGFTWQLRAELIKKYGAQKGAELVEDLVLPGIVSNARNISTAVRETMIRDDDDGNLGNGTPNLEQIKTAARKHGLDSALALTMVQVLQVGR